MKLCQMKHLFSPWSKSSNECLRLVLILVEAWESGRIMSVLGVLGLIEESIYTFNKKRGRENKMIFQLVCDHTL